MIRRLSPPTVWARPLLTARRAAPTTAFSKTPGWIRAVPISYNSPYVQQYSLDVQQQLAPSFMFDVGYFGDHGTHLLGALDINEPVPGSWVGKVSPVEHLHRSRYQQPLRS